MMFLIAGLVYFSVVAIGSWFVISFGLSGCYLWEVTVGLNCIFVVRLFIFAVFILCFFVLLKVPLKEVTFESEHYKQHPKREK